MDWLTDRQGRRYKLETREIHGEVVEVKVYQPDGEREPNICWPLDRPTSDELRKLLDKLFGGK